MAGNIELLLEAERRGILPPDKKALLAEARSRGLVAPPGEVNMSVNDRFSQRRADRGAGANEQEYYAALNNLKAADPSITPEQWQAMTEGRKGLGGPANAIGNIPVLGSILAPGAGDTSGPLAPMNPQQIAQNDQMFGFGDEMSSLTNSSDPTVREAWRRVQEARRNFGIEKNGPLGYGASILGQLTSMGKASPVRMNPAQMSPGFRAATQPSLAKTIATSTLTGGAMGGVQGYGTAHGDVQQRLEGAKTGAIAGGLVGAALPLAVAGGGKVVNNIIQNRATNAALKSAPLAEDLSSAASNLFKQSKSAGVGVKSDVFKNFAANLVQKAKAADIDPVLDGDARAVYDRLAQMAMEGAQNPEALSLSRLHNLRQIAQDVVMETKKNRTKMFAQDVIDGLDNLIENLDPSKMYIPPNLLGTQGANARTNAAGNALIEGISTWGRAKRVALIEGAIEKAKNYTSGFESGLVNQFKSLLNNRNTAKLFSPQERAAMQKVVRGSMPVKFLRTLGIFKGLGGAAIGSGLGPWGAAAGWALGSGGKKITEMATARAAQRAGRIAALPNIPATSGINLPMLPATTIPLLAPDYQQGGR